MARWVFKDLPERIQGRSLFHRILALRGIEGEESVAEFLTPEFNALYSPLLFKDMTRAVNRILAARDAGERIAIVGDYDADGITATAILCRMCAALEMERPVTILPHRLHDGYGLSPDLVDRAHRAGAGLIITVDNGITGHQAADRAAEAGIDLIITDHHRPPTRLPSALAILDPWLEGETYPFKELSGAGIAYKLAAAVLARTVPRSGVERFCKWAFDLVAIGTIADVVPLVGENRIFARLGLTVIPVSKSPGIRALAAVSRVTVPLDASMVAWRMAPRLNAAGRMADPALALDLLLETDEERATLLARELDRLNGERQALVNAALAQAREVARAARDAGEAVVIVRNGKWQHGIVGLIAGKLCEEMALPVVAMSNDQHEDVWVASCRSLPGFDVAACIEQFSGMFLKGGGHAAAGGFSIAAENLAVFEESLRSWARTNSTVSGEGPFLEVDCEISGSECTIETARELLKLAPFGAGNPEPVFTLSAAVVESCQPMGERGQHRRIRVRTRDGQRVDGVAFGLEEGGMVFAAGERISLAGHLGINTWNGQDLVRFSILDAKRE